MEKLSVGIVGGAGFTGGETLRLALGHPNLKVSWITSRSQSGKPVSDIHEDLVGQTELAFTDSYDGRADVVFLCLPHGKSRAFLEKAHYDPGTTIIDLSRDFRLAPDQGSFVYGLTELNKGRITQTNRIANPGCFATAIQLALLPMAADSGLNSAVHISAITGSTGAGTAALPTTHFSWRTSNMSVYKAFRHQHLDEIRQSVIEVQPGFEQDIRFIPYRGNFTRGIIATTYFDYEGTTAEAREIYASYYESSPFVHVTDSPVHLKQVVNTNNALLYIEAIDGQLMIVSVIDNLLKGASGQAIQNLNVSMGWKEDTGLKLKASYH